jgi:uncharacterized membrane protein YfcA
MDISQVTFEIQILHYVFLLLGSFLAAFTGSVLGVGGGFIILGLLSIVFPLAIMIPLLAAILACIDLSRAIAFRSHVQTNILYPFSIGCVVGVFAGSILFVSLSETIIGTCLGLLILLSLLKPTKAIRWKFKYPFVWLGTIHSFLSTMFGYGGILQAIVIRTSLGNLQITATLATSFLVLELLKISSYAIGGFDYQPYLGVIVVAVAGAIPASILGRKLAHRVSRKFYRTAQKITIVIIACNILYKVWA